MKKIGLIAVLLGLIATPVHAATQCVSTALAGGTTDVLTVATLPCSVTTTLLILTLSATNTTTTPTLQMTGAASQTIVNADGTALGVGQLVSGTIILLTNTGTQWRILNGAPK